MRILEKVKNTAYERTRHALQRATIRRLCEANNVRHTDIAIDLLRTLLSVRAHLTVNPDLLFDVGAHRGHFSKAAAEILGIRKLVCIEPDASLHNELGESVAGYDFVIVPAAAGSQRSSAQLHVHRDRSMNSLLPIDTPNLSATFASEAVVGQERVEVRTLDDIATEQNIPPSHRVLLKVDTQGNELDILHGAEHLLNATTACVIEHMFHTPYANATQFEDLIVFMKAKGFRCAGPVDLIRRPTHIVTGVDFLFLKEET